MYNGEESNVDSYLAILWIFLGAYVAYLMWKYPNHKVFPWHTYPTVAIQYFCGIGINLLIPIDLSVTIIGRQESFRHYYDENVKTIIAMYLSLYWPTLVLSNIVLVLQEQFNMSGFFTIGSKILDVCVQLSYQALAGIVVGSIFFGVLVGEHVIGTNMDAVLLTSVLITNTIGLIILMVLLGYGLVVFPQIVWGLGDYKSRLERTQHKACQEYNFLNEARLEISLCISNILLTKKNLNKTNRTVDQDYELIVRAIDILVSECPPEFKSSSAGIVALDKKTGKVSIKELAKLRQKLYWNKSNYTMSQQKISKIQNEAYFLEDLLNATSLENDTKTIKWSFKPESTKWEYLWYVKVQPAVCKFFGFVFGVVSLLSYLGVIGTISGVPLNFSPYFVAVHDKKSTGPGIVIFVLLTLGYACYVTIWALFEMKISGVMELVDNKGTWPLSMSFNARMVARLSAPLAFFYLGWVHENQTVGGSFENAENSNIALNTAFSRFYQIQVIPIMGNSMNTFFPILMICVSALTLTNILNRILVFCKCEKLQFGQAFLSEESLKEGKKKLKERKEFEIRKYNRKQFKSKVEKTSNVPITSTTSTPSASNVVINPMFDVFSKFKFAGVKQNEEENNDIEANVDHDVEIDLNNHYNIDDDMEADDEQEPSFGMFKVFNASKHTAQNTKQTTQTKQITQTIPQKTTNKTNKNKFNDKESLLKKSTSQNWFNKFHL